MANSTRLQIHVAQMVAIEGALCRLLDRLAEHAREYREVSELLSEIQATCAAQLDALRARLIEIGGTAPDDNLDLWATGALREDYPVTSSLERASTALNSTVFGYAMLRSIALRKRDSPVIGKGSTGEMAEAHTRSYVRALHRISQILHNVVLWELDREGEVCQCTCPSCGHGICLCSQSPRKTLSDIWMEAGPISQDESVYVHLPRPGSPAAAAGLKPGDRILEADGRKLESHSVLQQVISGHSSGDSVTLRVQRVSGDIEDVVIVRQSEISTGY